MKLFVLSISILTLFSCSTIKTKNYKSELFILGTLHSGGKKINSDSIYNAINKFKPDIILLEVETIMFESENKLKSNFDGSENDEFRAALRYQNKNPHVQLKPVELEGKNTFRKKLGIYSEADFVFKKIKELDSLNILKNHEKFAVKKLYEYYTLDNKIAEENLKQMNSDYSDNIIDSLMFYQYKKSNEIVNNHDDFLKYKLISSRKDTITFRQYFNNWSDFEGTQRNIGISENVLKIYNENRNKKIMLLVGYKHRFFVRKYLKNKNIKTLEYK